MFDPLQIPNVWRAQSLAPETSLKATGFAALDAALGGGWPQPAMIEMLTDFYGIGELQLILPLLRASVVPATPAPPVIAWINPPYEPNAVALAQQALLDRPHWLITTASNKDALWSMEQALKAGACAAVLAWVSSITTPSLRRLKLAMVTGNTSIVVYRSTAAASEPSPAHVRLLLIPRGSQLGVRVLKVRSRQPTELTLNVDPLRLQGGNTS
jgi:cell division inhibitor SulA/protein ImuA